MSSVRRRSGTSRINEVKMSSTSLNKDDNKIPTFLRYKLPALNDRVFDSELFLDSSNTEILSPVNGSEKIFTINTGLLESEPSILISSEFKPIYSEGERTKEGNLLNVKENGKIITAKTSIELLSQSEDVKKSAADNKKEVLEYIDKESSFMFELIRNMNKCLESLDLSTYAIPSFSTRKNVGSLYEILKKSGYSSSDIVKFSQTKLWQQSLIEVKKNLLSHSPEILSQNFNRNVQEDKDSNLLADLESYPKGQKRIWVTTYFQVPELKLLTEAEKIEENAKIISKFSNRQYINFANYGDSTENLPGKIIDTYIETSRDISIISNILFKEAFYSKYLSNNTNATNLSTLYGYQVSNVSNFKVWDYLIGRFPKNVTQPINNPTGNGYSLSSFSQKIIPVDIDYFNVLTFEKNYQENTNFTPGTYYYIDSCLNTLDGKNFDTTRLDQLIYDARNGHQTLATIFSMSGYSLERVKQKSGLYYEEARKSSFDSIYTLEGLVEKLSQVTSLYSKCIDIDPQFGHLGNLKYAQMKNNNSSLISAIESVHIRLASMICKIAVYPTGGYKEISESLKSYLFLWIMNLLNRQISDPDVVQWQEDFQTSYSSNLNENTLNIIKQRIASLLGSVKASFSYDDEIESARSNAQTYVLSLINSSEDSSQNSYLLGNYQTSIESKIFDMSGVQGVWGSIVSVLKKVYEDLSNYTDNKTTYSRLDKTSYLYCYFDLLLRIIAKQTPEELAGSYSYTFNYNHDNKKIVITEMGLVVKETGIKSINELFGYDGRGLLRGDKITRINKPLGEANQYLKNEEDALVNQLMVYRKYFFDLGQSLSYFRDFLVKNYQNQLDKMKSVYDIDFDLNDDQKNALINISFSEEQIRLSRYIMSEIKDRISIVSDSNAKIKSIPQLSGIPSGSIDVTPVNDTELVSFSILSPYFKAEQFLKEKGANKKIISVGIPPKLLRKLRTDARRSRDRSSEIKNSIVRIKVFKIDRLHPAVVYLPKQYLFQMNRYPTRILNNWENFEDFKTEDFNILKLPSKIVTLDGLVTIAKDFTKDFPPSDYGDYLTQQQKLEIYANHSISFLCEEYLRWFTDCRFDETRYHNFTQLDDSLRNVETQFKKYVSIVGRDRTTSENTPANSSQVIATFTDPTSGTTFEIPVEKNKNSRQSASSQSESTKKFIIPMNNTLRSYFLNETFLSDPNLFKKRITYPKKFDRVFSILMDPDDFYVDDSVTPSQVLQELSAAGVLSTDGSRYKNKDTGPDNVSMDEYFVTVEPFEYQQEYEE